MTRERADAHAGTYALGMDDETVTLHLTKPELFALSVALRLAGVLTVSRAHSVEAIDEEWPIKLGFSAYVARRVLTSQGPELMEKLRAAGGGL